MSNLSRIQTNNASLDACIEKANALPDAGSGGRVETCTVVFNIVGGSADTYLSPLPILTHVNGEYKPLFINTKNVNVTIQNCVCKQTFYASVYAGRLQYVANATIDGNATLIDPDYDTLWADSGRGVFLNANNGETVTFTAYLGKE